MSNKSYCNQAGLRPEIRRLLSTAKLVLCWAILAAAFILGVEPAKAGDAPGWMHALTNVPLPEHEEKTEAVLLSSEEVLTVQGSGKIKRLIRRAYKILRISGKNYGVAHTYVDSETKILNMHGWCIPATVKTTR